MCFGGSPEPEPTQAPAPAPPPPQPIAEAVDPSSTRKAEDQQNYGSTTPSLRVDRSATSGGATTGGTGIRM